MRFAKEIFDTPEIVDAKNRSDLIQQRPVVLGFNTEDIALLPGGEQGPAEGPNIPIKNYGGKYMPDGTQPTGYKPTPSALAFNPKLMIMNAIRGDVMDRPVGTGSTLQDAYRRGEPGVVKPSIPDTVRPSDSDDSYIKIMGSGFV